MMMRLRGILFVVMFVTGNMNIKLDTRDLLLPAAANVQMIFLGKPEFVKFRLQFFGRSAKIEQRGNGHVAADAAETIEIKSLHEGCEL